MVRTAEHEENLVHKPVLTQKLIEFIRPMEDGVYVDATIGLGGHTKLLLEATNYNSKVIGFDVDENAITQASKILSSFKSNVNFINKNFTELDSTLKEIGITDVDGIIADIGISSYQIESSQRGFSFLRDEPLDMRMDPKLQFTAYNLVNEMSFYELSGVLRKYGEESFSKNITRSILKTRESKPIRTSKELAAIVSNSIPKKFHPKKIHPATKTFQALRIAVNNELENLKIFIEKASKLLKPGGRLVIISFHSLEDRIVKRSFKYLNSTCTCPPQTPKCICNKKSVMKIITKTPIKPDRDEILENHRSRSSKMRVGEKI